MPLKQRFFFKKEERLCSRKVIDLVYSQKSQSIFINPLRLSWVQIALDTPFPAQVLIGVSKKKFRKATQRNRIKRQLREVYRKNKHNIYALLTSENEKFAFSLTYVGNKPMHTDEVNSAFLRIIGKLKTDLN